MGLHGTLSPPGRPGDGTAAGDTGGHVPVMLPEMLSALSPRAGESHLDATFGGGSYSRAILAAADCRLFAIDRDARALARGRELSAQHDGRLTLLHGRFGDMEQLLARVDIHRLDGVVMDLGLSSMQLDDPARGFSFRHDGPLDMRMDAGAGDADALDADADADTDAGAGDAADLVNSWQEADLAQIIRDYGEERRARRIAAAIVRERERAPIETTGQLAAIVRAQMPPSRDGIDPATRTFQALRIMVNDELGELDRALCAAERLLSHGGRLVVVAFHSLEDRRVKNFLKSRSGGNPRPSRHQPAAAAAHDADSVAPRFSLPGRRAIKPAAAELRANPRARSARLRLAVRRRNQPDPVEDMI